MKKISIMTALLISAMTLTANAADRDSTAAYLQTEGNGPAAVLHQLDVNKSPYYPKLDFYNMCNSKTRIILRHYPTHQQESEYTCGPAAALTVIQYLTGKTKDEMTIAVEMGTTKTGSTTHQMVDYFTNKGYLVHSSITDKTPETYEEFLAFVDDNLRNNVPVMVENIDWGGHWRVIIGHDTMGDDNSGNDVLILADPYDTTDHHQDGYNIVPAERFFYTWFDAHLFPESDRDKQWLTAELK